MNQTYQLDFIRGMVKDLYGELLSAFTACCLANFGRVGIQAVVRRGVNLVQNVGGHPVQGVWGTEVPQWGPGAKPRWVCQVWGTKSPRS